MEMLNRLQHCEMRESRVKDAKNDELLVTSMTDEEVEGHFQ